MLVMSKISIVSQKLQSAINSSQTYSAHCRGWFLPRHPIYSSPFCRRICALAFGPKKPKWYHSLSSAQLYLFKDIVNYVEVGRSGYFRFDDFLEALQDLDSTITRAEVVGILQGMEMDEFQELDFGKFLFLLAYKDSADTENVDAASVSSRTRVTPRQSIILSAISYYALIVSPEDIERYYIRNTRRKATVLHHHMEATRLQGLTERQMEMKQRNARKKAEMEVLYYLTGSPYALPVPFVPSFRKGKVYKEWKRSKYSIKPDDRFPQQYRRFSAQQLSEMGEKLTPEQERVVSGMSFGRIPLPPMRFASEIHKKLRAGGYTVELKDQLMEKAEEAVEEFRHALKESAVLLGKYNLKNILRQGFLSKTERDNFIEVYKRYFPLKVSEVKNYSLWVKPVGYRASHDRKPLYPDKIAFGRTLS